MSAKEPDITITMARSHEPGSRDPVWWVNVAVQGVGYNNADFEDEPEALLNWMKSTTAFAMGRIAAEQESKTRKGDQGNEQRASDEDQRPDHRD